VTDAGRRPVREVRLCLLGFGQVARRWCEIVADREQQLAAQFGVRFLVTSVGTARHGSLHHWPGLTPVELLELAAGPARQLPATGRPGTELVAASGADVLVEATVAEPDGAPVATAHVREALARGLHVVTVNKGPIAWHYAELAELARHQGRQLRFEGVTMDGVPVFNLVEQCLPGVTVLAVGGVLNSTTNFVLDAMAQGEALDAALTRARLLGFVEADPEHDLAGLDAAAKLAVLANVLLDATITPADVPRVDVRTVTTDRAVAVRGAGRRLRIHSRARRAEGRVVTSCELVEVGPDDPSYGVDAMSSLVRLDTDLAGTIEVVERRGGVTQTAYAVLSDLLQIVGQER
jgi:homoserine dehydrogenase